MNTQKTSVESLTDNIPSDVESTLNNLRKSDAHAKVGLPTIDGTIFIRILDICHFKSEDIYCRLIDSEGNMHFITKSLKWVTERLGKYAFYRIHKSFLINVYNIDYYFKRDGGYLRMQSGRSVPISRRKRSHLEELVSNL